MDTQKGTVLVFKSGVTQEEIDEALAKISDVLDHTDGQTIHEFEPKFEGPVWYCP